MSKSISETDVLVKIIDLLKPLASEERQRVISSAFLFLGETRLKADDPRDDEMLEEPGDNSLPTRAKSWMKQNSISSQELENVFHFQDNKTEIIDVPGKSNREKVINTYLLTGLASLFSTGAASFIDDTARTLCQSMGCYDKTNHSKYIKGLGNYITGNKNGGWTLTNPGLKKAAELIKKKTDS